MAIADWPGNVRQLANVVQAGIIRAQSEGAPSVQIRHLFPEQGSGTDREDAIDFHDAVHRYQAKLLRDALAKTDWNVSEAARSLGIARSTMNSLLSRHGLKRDGGVGSSL